MTINHTHKVRFISQIKCSLGEAVWSASIELRI